jgi:hypothetical protein
MFGLICRPFRQLSSGRLLPSLCLLLSLLALAPGGCGGKLQEGQADRSEYHAASFPFSSLTAAEAVRRAYRGLLWRDPDAMGGAYFTNLVQTEGDTGWLKTLAAIAESDEFRRHIRPHSDGEILAQMYEGMLGPMRPVDPSGEAAFLPHIRANRITLVAQAIGQSAEFYDRLRATPPPPPPPPLHPSPLVGRLRIEAGSFVDDRGPVLPIFCHFGEAFSRYVRDPAAVQRQLDVIARAGYHGIRFWTTLGGAYWAGREINDSVTAGYWDKLRDFLIELRSRKLRAVVSQGDIGRIVDRRAFASRLSDVMDAVDAAASVAIVEGGNETWQTGETDPRRLAEFVGWIKARHPATLYTLSSPPGETKAELDAWSIDPANMFDVHGYRGGHFWDKIRHIFSISYEGLPSRRLGWQGEPTGPGAAVSVTENKAELDDNTLAGMAAMSLMARQAWCYMSGPGVLFDSPLEAQPGFYSVPQIRAALPADVMRFTTLIHGGERWASQRIFAVRGDTRCDHALSADGRFVVIIYGPSLTYDQVKPATIEKVTDLGGKVRIITGRL